MILKVTSHLILKKAHLITGSPKHPTIKLLTFLKKTFKDSWIFYLPGALCIRAYNFIYLTFKYPEVDIIVIGFLCVASSIEYSFHLRKLLNPLIGIVNLFFVI